MIVLDRRNLIATLAVGLAVPFPAAAEPSPLEQETTELAWIVAGLTPLARDSDDLNRTTEYWRAAERWFRPFVDHPAVTVLGKDFSLPRLIGNAANYRFTRTGGLRRIPGSRPMWNEPDSDLFTMNLAKLEDFVRKSRAREFLRMQAPVLQASRAEMYRIHDIGDMQAWLEQQFTARPGTMQVYVSPVTGGFNFTNLDPITPRLWVWTAPRPASEYDRFRIVRAVFTEVDHNYVNPATARLPPVAYDFMTTANGWTTEAGWNNYPSQELVLNEYMTWAVFLGYAQRRMQASEFERIKQNTRAIMERRGFPRFGVFADALLMRNATSTRSLEEIYPAFVAEMRA